MGVFVGAFDVEGNDGYVAGRVAGALDAVIGAAAAGRWYVHFDIPAELVDLTVGAGGFDDFALPGAGLVAVGKHGYCSLGGGSRLPKRSFHSV